MAFFSGWLWTKLLGTYASDCLLRFSDDGLNSCGVVCDASSRGLRFLESKVYLIKSGNQGAFSIR